MKFIVNASSYYKNVSVDFKEVTEYYSLLNNEEKRFVGNKNIFQTKDAMLGIIERYSISNKSILSLGSGEAFEEYWFHKSNCRLVLNDIDQNNTFKEYLKSISEDKIDIPLVYHTCDASNILKGEYKHSFDVLYVSGFHPDEVRRENISANHIRNSSFLKQIFNRQWPENEQPYLETLVDAIQTVKKNGIAIFQHYRGGIDLLSNPNYLALAKKQFKKVGAEILEIYIFKESLGQSLVVLYVGEHNDAIKYAKMLKGKTKITTFHGRYPYKSIRTNVVRVFNILDPKPFFYKINDISSVISYLNLRSYNYLLNIKRLIRIILNWLKIR